MMKIWFGLVMVFGLVTAASAQSKGVPGRFDFYVLNLSWSPEFCLSSPGDPQCAAHPGFVAHGLWPENFNGSYPATCSKAKGPANYGQYSDISVDVGFLQHEWSKHGTCSNLPPNTYFQLERNALHAVTVPAAYQHVTQALTTTVAAVETAFQQANPTFPKGSFKVNCSDGKLVQMEACLAKDGVTPMVCTGVRDCTEGSIRVVPQ